MTDYFRNAQGNNLSDTLSVSVNDTQLTLPVNSISIWSSSGGKVVVDRGNSKEEIVLVTGKSGNNLVVASGGRGQEGTTGVGHDSGASVESVPLAGDWNDLHTGLNVEHNDDGTHKAATVTTLKASGANIVTGTSDVTIATPKAIKDAADGLITLTDVTTNDVSTSKHGFVPKAPNDTAKFLRGDATWAAATTVVDGWTPVTDSWTYASASTINVPSGAASLYKVGDKIKWTQTTVKYGVISAVADTLLTIIVNTDYVVTNAAISAISYSHQLNPIGFPASFAYTVTWAGGSPDIQNGTLAGRYFVVGRNLTAEVYMSCGSSTTFGSGAYSWSIPTAAASATVEYIGAIWILDSGAVYYVGSCVVAAGGSTIAAYVNNNGAAVGAAVPMTWANGDQFRAEVTYEI